VLVLGMLFVLDLTIQFSFENLEAQDRRKAQMPRSPASGRGSLFIPNKLFAKNQRALPL
jgi:hypothetical protein